MPNLRYIIKTIGKRGRPVLEQVRGLAASFIEKIPPKRRLPVLGGLCFCMALILALLVSVLVREPGRAGPAAADAAAAFHALAIPPEDLFLPGEPDFIPEVLLEQNPRPFWTAGDARPFWTDPLEYGSERWRAGIQSAVDELLEPIP